MPSVEDLASPESKNAAVGWLLMAVVAVSALHNALTGATLWAVVAVVVVAIVAVPAAVTGDWRAMVPWPLLLVGTAAVVYRTLGFSHDAAGYLVVATLALVVAVELDAYTDVEMSRRFAVAFGVMTTMAAQGVWTVAQYFSDMWLDTAFLTSQRELQVDIVVVTAVGVLMGAAFEWYAANVEGIDAQASTGRSTQQR